MHGASECGHWVWSVGGGYTFYLVMKYPTPLVSVLFSSVITTFVFYFCKLLYFLAYIRICSILNMVASFLYITLCIRMLMIIFYLHVL